jgi:glycosyltransferase involved in cell wall biosynthesis
MHDKISVMVLGLRGFPLVQGGVETHAEHLYTELAQLGCDIEVLVRNAYQPHDNLRVWKGIRFTRLWAPRKKSLEAILHSFLGVLYAAVRRPDVLHIHAIGPALMTPLARLLGLNVVVTHHGPDYDRQKWGLIAKTILRTGELLGMRFAHERIVISNVIRSLIQEKYKRASVLIPNGVTLPSKPATTTTPERFGLKPGKYILLVGRLVPEKRHLDLIQAFSKAKLDGWSLAIVGAADHPDDYMMSVLDTAASTPNVICTGFQSGLALQELYAHAGLFVLPSSHEGLPIALLEALSYGLPALASDIPANLEVCNPGISFFPLGDVDKLAEVLHARAAAPHDAALAEAIRRHVAENYRWSAIAHETRMVYARIVKQATTALADPEAQILPSSITRTTGE